MKETTNTPPQAVPTTPGGPKVVDIHVTEEELQKIRERLNQKNSPQKPPTLSEGWGTISADDLLSVHTKPCAREGFLTGIGGGAAAGGLRYILGAPIPRAANWAVGFGVLFAVVRYEVCQAHRRKEHAMVKRVVKIQEEKQAEARREAAKAAEEAAAATSQKSWYRFW